MDRRLEDYRDSRYKLPTYRMDSSSSISDLCILLSKHIFEASTREPHGLVVISGPTAIGKSTIARLMLRYYLTNLGESSARRMMRRPHLVTFEDPIEATFFGDTINQGMNAFDYTPRQKGIDVIDLREAVRDALEQRPKVLFVGETRNDTDWGQLIQFAETRRLAVTTTNAPSLVEAMSTLVRATNAQMPTARRLLAHNVLAVVHLSRSEVEEGKSQENSLVISLWRNSENEIESFVADGLSSLIEHQVAEPHEGRVYLLDVFPQILDILRKDYSYIYHFTPDQFELLICDRLMKMGFDVERVGSIYSPDGGVDIVAWPRTPSPFPFLLAAQVKHHRRPSNKTGPNAVKDLQSIIANQPFQAGILVTNTGFTPNARWFGKYRSHIVRLRDMHDLKRWISDDFGDEEEWREIPSQIELCPGVVVRLRRS